MLCILAVIGVYLYDIFANGTAPTEHIFRTVSIVLLSLAGFLRTFSRSRRPLRFYEEEFKDIFKDAFEQRPFLRMKLTVATRLLCEERYRKALKHYFALIRTCKTKSEYYAVYLLAARTLSSLDAHSQAQALYQQLINAQIADSRIYSNMGASQVDSGDFRKALQNYHYALEYDRDNVNALNNIAQAHFKLFEFDQAIPYALKAIEKNPRMRQASVLLAIIYNLTGDSANAEKYFHMAISSGEDPEHLKQAIRYYRNAKQESDDEAEENAYDEDQSEV